MLHVQSSDGHRAHARWLVVVLAGAAMLLGGLRADASESTPHLDPDFVPGQVVGESLLPGLGVRLVDAPIALREDPRAQIYVVDHLPQGATIVRHVDVSNGTDSPLEVNLLAAPASVEGGWNVPPDDGRSEIGAWTSVEPPQVTLAPNERRRVRLTIAVPPEAGGGERYGVLLASAQFPGQVGPTSVTSQVGVRIYLSVGGGAAPPIDMSIDELSPGRAADGSPVIVVGITNTGERALDVTGSLELLDGPGRLTGGPFEVAIPQTVGPGDTSTVTVPLDQGLPDGPWTARVRLRSGLVERTAEATVTFPQAAGVFDDPVPAHPVNRTPWLAIAFLLILLTLAGLWALGRLGLAESPRLAKPAGEEDEEEATESSLVA